MIRALHGRFERARRDDGVTLIEALVVIAPQARVFDALSDLSISVPYVTLESTGRNLGHSLSVDQVAGAIAERDDAVDELLVNFSSLSGDLADRNAPADRSSPVGGTTSGSGVGTGSAFARATSSFCGSREW